MVVSVGPPSDLSSSPGFTRQSAAGSAGGIRSPLIITSRRAASEDEFGPAAACSAIRPAIAGTEFQIVTPNRSHSSSQCAGSAARSASGSTIAAPADSAPNTS